MLRQYCMGDSPIQFNIISDQTVNFNTTQSVLLCYVCVLFIVFLLNECCINVVIHVVDVLQVPLG